MKLEQGKIAGNGVEGVDDRGEPFPPPGLDVQPLEEIVVRRSDKGLIEGHPVVAGNVVLGGVSLD